jgi:hypothetical protein
MSSADRTDSAMWNRGHRFIVVISSKMFNYFYVFARDNFKNLDFQLLEHEPDAVRKILLSKMYL